VIGADHLAQILRIEPRSGRCAPDPNARAGAAAAESGLPQPPQNLAAGSLAKPQAGQGKGSSVPHSAQKRLVAVFSAMQLRQRIWYPRRRTPAVQAKPAGHSG